MLADENDFLQQLHETETSPNCPITRMQNKTNIQAV